jgi:hypothetical protein
MLLECTLESELYTAFLDLGLLMNASCWFLQCMRQVPWVLQLPRTRQVLIDLRNLPRSTATTSLWRPFQFS